MEYPLLKEVSSLAKRVLGDNARLALITPDLANVKSWTWKVNSGIHPTRKTVYEGKNLYDLRRLLSSHGYEVA
jgi:hypothetical protein